jgi:LacI family transcriptional regulator
MAMARVTLADVAQKAGVSNWTVSVVLNRRQEADRLSDECIERVRNAARELGYQGNYHARTLSRGKAMTLGFISRYNERDIMRPMIESGFTAEGNTLGYEMLSLSDLDGEAAIQRAARYVQQGRIDGFAIFSGVPPYSHVAEQIPPSVPLVHVWFHPLLVFPLVTIDAAPGLHDAVAHLAELGHRRLFWLDIRRPSGSSAPDRRQAVREAVAEQELELSEHLLEMSAAPTGRPPAVCHKAVRERLDVLGDATAVLCYNDALAAGLCAALRENGRRVPEDVSVVGFDDVQAYYAVPQLTSVSHRFAEMGRTAVRHLAELIESGEDRGEEVIRVPSRLVVRESTGPAPE